MTLLSAVFGVKEVVAVPVRDLFLRHGFAPVGFAAIIAAARQSSWRHPGQGRH